jgi:hypothetical protein
MVKVGVPVLYDKVGIFIDDGLYLFHVVGFDIHLLPQHKLVAIPVILGHSAIPLHMHMDGFVLSAIKEE